MIAQSSQKYCAGSENCIAAGRGSSGISSPSPAPVKGAELETMRNTSAKASVTSAKYDPRSP